MTWTRRSLRAFGALGLALLFYAATPHVHLAPHGAATTASGTRTAAWRAPRASGAEAGVRTVAARLARQADATATDPSAADPAAEAALASDDAHESHRLTRTGDGHPCTLCRNGAHRASAHLAPAPCRLADADRARLDAPRLEAWPARPLADRHAARAPPSA